MTTTRSRTPTTLSAVRWLSTGLAWTALAAATVACGGEEAKDPATQVPAAGGLRDRVRDAQWPNEIEFPATQGRTLQELGNSVTPNGAQVGLATSVFTVGRNRLAFGVIDSQGQFVYGRSAVYIARGPNSPAKGPFLAPADILLTEGRYRSKQAATEQDPFAAVYAAEVAFDKPGDYSVVVLTEQDGKLGGAAIAVSVSSKRDDLIPDVGERAPAVPTDTIASAGGDVEAIDTRVPPSDMHKRSFAEVAGTKPVALLFATPQLCQSRVCGPVTDVALQLKARYGDRVEFIHQEVYEGNDPAKGLREPLKAFNLQTEPWLFVVGADGRITARLEGSFGLGAFEQALETAL